MNPKRTPAMSAMATTSLLLFTKDACPPCSHVKSWLPALALPTGVELRVIQLEEAGNAQIFSSYGVSRTPTFVLDIDDNPNKRRCPRYTGATKDDVEDFLEAYLPPTDLATTGDDV